MFVSRQLKGSKVVSLVTTNFRAQVPESGHAVFFNPRPDVYQCSNGNRPSSGARMRVEMVQAHIVGRHGKGNSCMLRALTGKGPREVDTASWKKASHHWGRLALVSCSGGA